MHTTPDGKRKDTAPPNWPFGTVPVKKQPPQSPEGEEAPF